MDRGTRYLGEEGLRVNRSRVNFAVRLRATMAADQTHACACMIWGVTSLFCHADESVGHHRRQDEMYTSSKAVLGE